MHEGFERCEGLIHWKRRDASLSNSIGRQSAAPPPRPMRWRHALPLQCATLGASGINPVFDAPQ